MFLSVENIATLTSQKFISREAFAKDYPVYPKHGDVLMTRIGDIGTSNVVETDDKLAFYVSLALLKPFDVDSYYLDKSLQSPSAKEELYRRTLHIAFPKKINKNQIAEVMLPIPRSRQEQEQIGALFRDLDSLITLHQRKYDKLCVLKKSMLDKMFPKGGSLYPEIRFAGFTDPWEQRKLGEVARRVTRKNENGDSDLPLTISAQYGLVDQRTFFNSQVASKDMSGYFLLHRGEFAYNKSTSTDSPWGAIKRLEKYDMGCVSTLYICFELLSGDPDFLVTYYETDRWYKSVQLIAAEGARNHGLLNIAPDDFFETQICIPKRIDEQRRIGAFFDRLDSLITLHQRKYDGCANPLFLERRISCRKPSHQNRCSATTTPSG